MAGLQRKSKGRGGTSKPYEEQKERVCLSESGVNASNGGSAVSVSEVQQLAAVEAELAATKLRLEAVEKENQELKEQLAKQKKADLERPEVYFKGAASVLAQGEVDEDDHDFVGSGAHATIYGCTGLARKIFKVPDLQHLLELQELSKHVAAKEIEIHSRLRHPHIVQYHFSTASSNKVTLYLEKCDGGTLEDYLHGSKVTAATSLKYVRHLVKALVYLREQNILHGDFKPANILLKRGVCKLADFGTAIELAPGQTVKGDRGTPLYSAPEVSKGQPYDHACDVWSLGMVVCELLGVTPKFRARGRDSLEERVAVLCHDLVERQQPQGASFVRQCLHVDPEMRSPITVLANHPFLEAPTPPATAGGGGGGSNCSSKAGTPKHSARSPATTKLSPVASAPSSKGLKSGLLTGLGGGASPAPERSFPARVRRTVSMPLAPDDEPKGLASRAANSQDDLTYC